MRILDTSILPNERAVIIDGRIFYDLGHLIEQFAPTVASDRIAADAMRDPEDIAYVEGEEFVLKAIQESHANLTLEHDMGV